jgi:hypothetical protein
MHSFTVDAVGFKTVAFALGLILVPLAITLVALRLTQGRSLLAAAFAVAVCLLAGGAILAQLFLVKARIDGSKLTVGGGLYSVTIDSSAIRKDEVRPVAGAYSLGHRSNGIGMPGLALGWFQPGNGKPVFALLTDRAPILVPTTLDYDVVVSPADSERFLSAIKGM